MIISQDLFSASEAQRNLLTLSYFIPSSQKFGGRSIFFTSTLQVQLSFDEEKN